ncbi:MAG: LLM class flavin-dependent oxidoreductase [Nitrososphaerales archaeon]
MEIGALIKPDPPIPEIVRLAKLCEDSGFDFVGTFDDLLFPSGTRKELYVTLTSIALNTSRIRLGSWATNSWTRHPILNAYAMATLDALCGKRTYIGIAWGGPHARSVSFTKPNHKRCEEALIMMRKVLNGEQQEINGWKYKLHEPMPHIPIFWACQAEQSIKLGCRHANGLIIGGPIASVHEQRLSGTLQQIENSIKEAGRTRSDVQILMNTPVSISTNREEAIDDVMAYLRTMFTYIGLGPDRAPPREVVSSTSMSGTPEDCINGLKLVKRLGIDKVGMVLPDDIPRKEKTIKHLKEDVFPHIN